MELTNHQVLLRIRTSYPIKQERDKQQPAQRCRIVQHRPKVTSPTNETFLNLLLIL